MGVLLCLDTQWFGKEFKGSKQKWSLKDLQGRRKRSFSRNVCEYSQDDFRCDGPKSKALSENRRKNFCWRIVWTLWLSSLILENIFSVEALYNILLSCIINVCYVNNYISHKIRTYAINQSYQGIYFPLFRWFSLKEIKCNNIIPHKYY